MSTHRSLVQIDDWLTQMHYHASFHPDDLTGMDYSQI